MSDTFKNESHNSNEAKPLPGHEYDGIQELDNGIPFWFQGFFALTVVFSVAYFYYYEIGDGPGSAQEYAQEVSAHKALTVAAAPSGPQGPTAEVLAAAYKDDKKKAVGKAVYLGKCAACHAVDGGGVIGPNLTDKNWIHGGSLEKIAATVAVGVLAKGMPGWKDLMTPDEMIGVVAYVKSLEGTKAANPKAPEGVLEK